jgi:ribonuclease Z
MALRASNGNCLLLDIGEGTIGQLVRAQQEEQETQAAIKAVWVSHPHADHHLGILRLLHDRKALDPLLLMAPTPLFEFLEEYCLLDPSIRDRYVAVDCKDLTSDNATTNVMLQEMFGITDIRSVPVAHCSHAFAIVLDGTPFGRLVYSGDCRPSKQLAAAGRNADLLVHEATFEDGLEAEALLKKHSTVGEALGVAHDMMAKAVVLTHFSQRYPRIPPMSASEQGSIPIVFAFDYMRLTPSTLLAASKLTPSLRLLYPEDDEAEKATNEKANAILSVPGVFAKNGIL